MQSDRSSRARMPAKAPTGIAGFDAITGGGLPRGRTTLLVGGPGSGKTVLALQFLAHGAQDCKQPGIFVAFEETSKRIVANAASFGWKLGELRRKKLFFMDAQPLPDLVQSGDFDLSGMLAALGVKDRDDECWGKSIAGAHRSVARAGLGPRPLFPRPYLDPRSQQLQHLAER